MKKLYLLIPILFLIYLGCEDEKSSLVPEDEKSYVSGEVELWGDCYSIENTDSLNLASSNQVKGLIPPEIGNLTNLTYLTLLGNGLTGPIPPEIGNLTKLIKLNLGTNQLTGSLPPEIGNLANLTHLMLNVNQLTGEIPSEIGKLTNLEGLGLAYSQFSGEIPPEVGNLNNLTGLNLSFNQLTGKIPESICDIFPNLSFLFSVSNNQLCPPYPSCIENYVGQQNTTNCS